MSAKDAAVDPSMAAPGDDLELLSDEDGRWTIVPVAAEGDERLTQWLTVDADTLFELDDWR
ncbi:hypothetical protein Halru_0928 [Halovivax ruber XH-70]|uniref:DUF7511 domain-containing protein n=2 Tax=Halovivax TaxID=332951 RepID=L0I9P3_HALRX|nr:MULTISPECIES: hypothetical protein [Halovivax]AGB15548.1 hypothetical protein Halru_0928 [Halovivax ruber XH-70]ELZ12510.1 hypothetical protein C479_03917 [Halovivax asiaticus JCM 14624]